MLERVVSGGRTVVEQAGWRVARMFRVPTGISMPEGLLTEDAPLRQSDGTERIRDESNTDFARLRGGNGAVIGKATGCRDGSVARQLLADLEGRAKC